MTLANAIMMEQRSCTTENGAYAHTTSGSALVDLFAMAGAMRTSSEDRIRSLFNRAFIENPMLGVKLAFYVRDVREGLGERSTGRTLFRTLADTWPQALKYNLKLIPEYGRWDDLLVCLNTPLEEEAVCVIRGQLEQDCRNMLEGKPVSLLAKWMPSVNASSLVTRRSGKRLAKLLGIDEKTYRRTLSALRSFLNVTEKNLSADTLDCIRYSEVPSCAMMRYRKVFMRKDENRFHSFLSAVEKGAESIHGETLFPYDIVEKYLYGKTGEDEVLEAQWKALPEFVSEENRFLVMADVSGSMYGRPLAASLGLALYFSERAKGPFHNRFMTFSKRPELVEIQGKSLYERICYAKNADWNMNTDLRAAFEVILSAAVKNRIPQDELPSSLIVITDMEIDNCTTGGDVLFTDMMKERYASFGYTLPNLVFWNVSARNSTFHSSMDIHGVQLVSGHSPSVFASLAERTCLTPYEYVKQVLESPRYDPIVCPSAHFGTN